MPSEVFTALFTPMLRSDEAPTAMSSISPLSSLPAEARNHIFEFLPKKDALVLCRVCSQWNAHVRHSGALWAGEMERCYPITFERLQSELAAKTAAAGGHLTYGEGVDYLRELAKLKQNNYGSLVSKHSSKETKAGSSMFCCCAEKPKGIRTVIIGLDGAGKTTLMYSWLVGGHSKTGPITRTLGYTIEETNHKGRRIALWDVGGLAQFRPLWSNILMDHVKQQSIIFVIDGSDYSRLGEATQALVDVLKYPEPKTPLLVLVNKLDLAQCMSIERVHFELRSLLVNSSRPWCVQGCSAMNLRGVSEGLDWISAQTHQ